MNLPGLDKMNIFHRSWQRMFDAITDPLGFGPPDYPLLPPYEEPARPASPSPPKIIVIGGSNVKKRTIKKPKEKTLE